MTDAAAHIDVRKLAKAIAKELIADNTFRSLVKDIALQIAVHYSALEKMDRGRRVWEEFRFAGVRVALTKEGGLRCDPVERVTPALRAIFEVHWYDLRDYVRTLANVEQYENSLSAELWPSKAPLGVLEELRGKGLRASIDDAGTLKLGPPEKITAGVKKFVNDNRQDLVRELCAENRQHATNGTAQPK